jgi:hypothetical protein
VAAADVALALPFAFVWLICPLATRHGVAQAHAHSTPVFRDEQEACSLESFDQGLVVHLEEPGSFILDLKCSNRRFRNARRSSQIALVQTGECSRGAAKTRGETHSHQQHF